MDVIFRCYLPFESEIIIKKAPQIESADSPVQCLQLCNKRLSSLGDDIQRGLD